MPDQITSPIKAIRAKCIDFQKFVDKNREKIETTLWLRKLSTELFDFEKP